MTGKGERLQGKGEGRDVRPRPSPLPFTLVPVLLIFLAAFGVRLLALHDSRLEAARVQWAVAANYRHSARLLAGGGAAAFFGASSPLADPDTLGHPPGYPLMLALVSRLAGAPDVASSEDAARLVQIAGDAGAAALLFLLVAELLPFGAAVIAGLLAALAPQFTWNSVLPLPDTLAALFVLLAVCLVARAARRPRFMTVVLAGMSVGLSCWLRSNALLLAPFLAAAVLLSFGRERRGRYALLLVAGAVVVVAPLTIRNALVFGRFIPLSLGAGQTLLEGIADYDDEGRFGIPRTDLGIMRQEAAATGRADYAATLFGPDAVARERARLRRGFSVIASHPLWFASVMARRAVSMLRLERARLVSPRPPATHAPEDAERAEAVWSQTPSGLSREGAPLAPRAVVSLAGDGAALRVVGDESKFGRQFTTAPVAVEAGTDYVFKVPVRVESGRMSVEVLSAEEEDAAHVSTVVETEEGKAAAEQPARVVALPFANAEAGRVRLVLTNAPSEPPRPVVEIVGEVKLHRLGPASLLWTRYPRLLVNAAQRLFVTAVMLPPALVGLLLLARARERRALVLLLAVPVYYMCVQSALHTEYRYVLAIHYFLFALAAFALYRAGLALRGAATRTRRPLVETEGGV